MFITNNIKYISQGLVGGSCFRVVVHKPCLTLSLLDFVNTVQNIASVRWGHTETVHTSGSTLRQCTILFLPDFTSTKQTSASTLYGAH